MTRPVRRRSSAGAAKDKKGISRSPTLEEIPSSPLPSPVDEACTDLRDAAIRNDVEATGSLIENGAPLDSKGSFGWTALHMAAKYGHEEIVLLLVNAKADIRIRDDAGRTAAEWASRKGLTRLCKVLGGDKERGKEAYESAKLGTEEVLNIFDAAADREGIECEALKWAAFRGDIETTMVLMKLVGGGSAVSALAQPFPFAVPTCQQGVCKFLLQVKATASRRLEDSRRRMLKVRNSEDSSEHELEVSHNASVAECLLQAVACMDEISSEQWPQYFDTHELKFVDTPLVVTRTLESYDVQTEATLLLAPCSAGQKARVCAYSEAKCALKVACTADDCSSALTKAEGMDGLETEVGIAKARLVELAESPPHSFCCVLQ